MDNKSQPIQNLQRNEAVAKIQELVKHNGICMFTSSIGEVPLQTRPMSTQEVDDDGNFWFFSSKESHKNSELSDDPRVQLLFANTSQSEFLTVYGQAIILHDRKKIEEMWSPIVKAWFQEGKDDPDLTLIKVVPESAYYWDSKDNKMISLLKIAASAISGKTMDIGVEGTLQVN
ncbi:MAG: pyridoxamine 5'-phosphate oxidase family protein [Cyclobacteriaceae bacterium]